MAARTASTAARAWACRSRATWRSCWAGRSMCRAHRARAASSPWCCHRSWCPHRRSRTRSAAGGTCSSPRGGTGRRTGSFGPGIATRGGPSCSRSPAPCGRASILVIEDDVRFAQILSDLAREMDFDCHLAHNAADGLAYAMHSLPSAIVLDVNLPDFSGLGVLDQLKRNPATRHIPVHVVSVADYSQEALGRGAWAMPSNPSSATSWCMPYSASKPSSPRACGACWWWKTTSASARACAICSPTTTWRSWAPARQPRRWRTCAAPPSTAW